MEKIIDKLELVETLIRSNQLEKARANLRKITLKRIPSSSRVKFASLARRAGIPSLALRLLNPIVSPKGRQVAVATDLEKCEYAASLTKVGAITEALSILQKVDANAVPEALLYEAFACFSIWDYARSVSFLDQYVASAQIKEYERIVGEVNLAVALVSTHDNRADSVIESLLSKCNLESYALAYGYTLMTQAEHFINQRRFDGADECIRMAEKVFQRASSLESFFLQKWKAILALYRSPSAEKAKILLDPIRKEALSRRHWETIRSCDFHQALILGDEKLFLRLYFGTPFEPFRQLLIKKFPKRVKLPAEFSNNFEEPNEPNKQEIVLNGLSRLKVGKLPHKLFSVLASDFYRPFPVGALHSLLFPGDYYNPISSPIRVRLVIHRTRSLLNSMNCPIEIKESLASYFLKATSPCTLKVPHQSLLHNPLLQQMDALKRQFGEMGEFSAKQAGDTLGISLWIAIRLLNTARTQGEVIRCGKGKNTLYRFSSESSEALRTSA